MGFMEAWSKDSETDGRHPVHPSKPSGQPRQVATRDWMAPCPPLKSHPSKHSGQPQQVAILRIPCPPLKTLWAAAAGCNSKDSETDGWHPLRPSKPAGQPQQVASLETDGWHPVHPSASCNSRDSLSAPQNPLGCNSKDSETDGWDPVHPSKMSGQPQQVAILGIPRLTDGTLSGWHPVYSSKACGQVAILAIPKGGSAAPGR